ncbi:ubiquitin carboxyl-terminal hydrolase puf-like [Photinus pyralis]|uniref:ubiquitin carboxyl-terminal hydrolase puf-like n=1 Tax=Photinus pyralis TaxID=7054 RepID=UPI0012673B86|nr:ubiquitin carboxyl-terminal hydrolase puf-like [Photinus pyralis]
MCDACSDFLQLLISYEANLCKEINEQPTLTRQDINTILVYVQAWVSRQCMCCYRDQKNLERFSCITQGILYLTILHLKELGDSSTDSDKKDNDPEDRVKAEENSADVQERDKLFILASKIFLLNFPLYVAFKHTATNKIDDLTQHEIQSLNSFCDLHDSEIPLYLLRNVTLFCKLGGLHVMTACFTFLSPSELPVSTAHAMISIVCNLKLWMNFKSTVSLLVPLRSCVLRYMCKLSDQDLRTPTIKGMAGLFLICRFV